MSENIWVYAVELRVLSHKYRRGERRDFLGVPLPTDVSDIGITGGQRLRLSEEYDDVGYVSVNLLDEDEPSTRYDYKVRENTDWYPPLIVRLPIEWTDHNEISSFFGAEKGDQLVVEMNRETGELRIYNQRQYQNRMTEVWPTVGRAYQGASGPPLDRKDAPERLPLFQRDEFVDVFSQMDSRIQKQRFVFHFFDGRDPAFYDEAQRQNPVTDSGEEPTEVELTSEILETVRTEMGLTPVSIPALYVGERPAEKKYLEAYDYGRTVLRDRKLSTWKLKLPKQLYFTMLLSDEDEEVWNRVEVTGEKEFIEERGWSSFDGWRITSFAEFRRDEQGRKVYHVFVPDTASYEMVDNGQMVHVRWETNQE
jgi:hypothetical protein